MIPIHLPSTVINSKISAQDTLDEVRKTRKQDKLLSTVKQDVAHDVGPTDHLHNSMWDYLKKYQR